MMNNYLGFIGQNTERMIPKIFIQACFANKDYGFPLTLS